MPTKHEGDTIHAPPMIVRRQESSSRVDSRVPDLFLIGAMKAGTTYMRKLLASHPAIFMCEPDEPSYFVDPRQLKEIWRDMWERGIWRSEAHYLRLFQPGVNATILGEASTNYTKLPLVTGVPEKIQAFNPNARFIYLLRDPIERTISHYWHMVIHHAEHRSIFRAIREDNQYLAVSHYAMQIKPYLERFGSDRVAIVTLESLARQPVKVMRELYDWLGVDMSHADVTGFAQPENVTPEVISMALWGGLPRRLRQSPPFRSMFAAIPQPIQTVLRQLVSRDVRRYSVDLADAVAYLRPIQRRQTEELARMLGREFPEWTTLMDAAAARSSIPDPGVIGTSHG